MSNRQPTIRWGDAIRFWTIGAIAMFMCMMGMMLVRMGGKMIRKAISKLTAVVPQLSVPQKRIASIFAAVPLQL